MENEFKKLSRDQEDINKKLKCKSYLKRLKVSLKYRPDVLKYILKLRHCLKMKNKVISKYKKKLEDKSSSKLTKSQACQTEKTFDQNSDTKVDLYTDNVWDVCDNSDDKIVSIADQVKEAAQNALAESGMVYVESAGMYYDYKTGYYYNSELGLYYHTSTGCYYAYSNDDKSFTFHSYADNSKFLAENKAHVAHEKKKAKRQRKDNEDDAKDEVKMKRKKCSNSNIINEESKVQGIEEMTKDGDHFCTEPKTDATDINCDDSVLKQPLLKESKPKSDNTGDLEDGECSQTDSDLFESNTSTATVSDDDSVARHHPPCMRIIVRETNLSKLKVGTLFLITKDGGTIGREGDTHTVLLKDHNVSRNHLDIRYDNVKRAYVATDLGSKNGTILNGTRMSESQEISFPTEIPHGSILQVGETKLLCHIHLGNDTCGHCEPGLVMAAEDEQKRVAYTRTCSVQKQHQLELARLKNKYAPEPLAIEDSSYNDRAKARREKFGSSHHAEKTQQSNLETSITSENKGFQLMEKMGWSKGEGLGKDSQGDTEPVPLVSNESKAGLGAAGSANPVSTVAAGSARPMRLTARAKPLRPPASVFRDPLEDDDD